MVRNPHRASGIPGQGDRRERHCGYMRTYLVTLKEYAQDCGGCNDIRLCIERQDLGGFDDGVVVGPGLFETMREQFCTGGVRREPQTRKPVAAAQNPPTIQRTFFIVMPPLCNLTFFVPVLRCASLVGCGEIVVRCWSAAGAFAGAAGTATLWVWIRFDLDGCLELERV